MHRAALLGGVCIAHHVLATGLPPVCCVLLQAEVRQALEASLHHKDEDITTLSAQVQRLDHALKVGQARQMTVSCRSFWRVA